jgi:hypothetical protein
MEDLIVGQDYERLTHFFGEWNVDNVGKFIGKDTNYYQKMAEKGTRYSKPGGGVYTTEPAYKFMRPHSLYPHVHTQDENACYRRTTAQRNNVTQVFEHGTERSNAELRAYLESDPNRDPSLPPIEPRAPQSGAPGTGPADLIAAFAGLNAPKSVEQKEREVKQLSARLKAAERKEKEAIKLEDYLKVLAKQATAKRVTHQQNVIKKNPGNRPPRPGFVNATRALTAADQNVRQKEIAVQAASVASQEAVAGTAAARAALTVAEADLAKLQAAPRMLSTQEEAYKNAANAYNRRTAATTAASGTGGRLKKYKHTRAKKSYKSKSKKHTRSRNRN